MSESIANPALAEVEIEEMNRSAFIAKGALAVGAVYGMTMVGPFIRKAFAQGEMGDIDILNFALTLEYLEAAFYDQAKSEGKYDAETTELVDLVGKDEAEHVSALKATISDLGGSRRGPGVDFGNASRTRVVPGARADVRGHPRQRLQRRRPGTQVEGAARHGRTDRPGRGAPRSGHQAAQRESPAPESSIRRSTCSRCCRPSTRSSSSDERLRSPPPLCEPRHTAGRGGETIRTTRCFMPERAVHRTRDAATRRSRRRLTTSTICVYLSFVSALERESPGDWA